MAALCLKLCYKEENCNLSFNRESRERLCRKERDKGTEDNTLFELRKSV
jgi:hypothetical protein